MSATHAHLGEAIRARREELGLTQEQLCERLGWRSSRKGELSEIENGKKANLKFDRLILFARALSLPVGLFVESISSNTEAA